MARLACAVHEHGPAAQKPGTPNALFYMTERIFCTDQRTFQERYRLVEKENLQGFCSWVLGEEDPDIWKLLPEHK